MCVCACTWMQLLWEATRGIQVPWSCIWKKMGDTLHETGRPGSWDPHWNPLLEQCVSHLSILTDRFSKTLTHSLGRSIPLHIICIQTHQLLSITECRGKKRKWERESRGLFFLFSSMKRLFVHRPLYVEVHVLLLTFSDFFFMEEKVRPESDFYYTEWMIRYILDLKIQTKQGITVRVHPKGEAGAFSGET